MDAHILMYDFEELKQDEPKVREFFCPDDKENINLYILNTSRKFNPIQSIPVSSKSKYSDS